MILRENVTHFLIFFRYNANKATEDAIREHNARMKPIWDAEKAAAKAKSDREGLLYLAKETGVKVSFFKPLISRKILIIYFFVTAPTWFLNTSRSLFIVVAHFLQKKSN